AVEDSVPFWSSVAITQIRFSAKEPSLYAVAVATGAETSAPIRVEDKDSVRQPVVGSERNAALRSALNAGVIAAVLSSLPLGPAFIFALPLAVFLCVLFYRRRS